MSTEAPAAAPTQTGTPAPAATGTATAQSAGVIPGNTIMTTATQTPPAADPAAPAAVDPAAPPAEAPKVAAPVVPEKYEFKAPEGVELDSAQIEAFTPIAKELGLTNEQAQKLVDLQTANVKNMAVQQEAAWKAVTDKWAAETKADKDIGGLKFAENIGVAAKAIDKFGTPELRRALDDSGMGNHPAVVKFFVNVGRQLGEDNFASGNAGGGGAPKSAAEILFPNLKP